MGINEAIRFRTPYIWTRRRRWHTYKHNQFAEGIIRVRRLPDDWTEKDYRHWWIAEYDGEGKLVHLPRMSEREKEHYQEAEFCNNIMIAGRTQVLTYIGSTSGNATGFAKYLALGVGALMAPIPTDIKLINETIRKTQVSYIVQGSQVDINFTLTSGDANVTMTEAGIYGGAATGTKDSGTLMTHALFSYTKGAYSIAVDYLVNLL